MTLEVLTPRLPLRPVQEDDLDVLLAVRNAPGVATTSTGDAIEIGVLVHPDHWGKGFALEAGLGAARHLVERVALDRVYAGVDPENEKSLRALAKERGVRRVDDELYELTADALR